MRGTKGKGKGTPLSARSDANEYNVTVPRVRQCLGGRQTDDIRTLLKLLILLKII